jgi:DNA polymerase type B, organellar and viral
MRDVKAHYIRANESARIPQRFVILDTEAYRKRDKTGEVQTWSLAVATFLTWDKNANISQHTSRFNSPIELWQAVSEFTRIGRRTVLYAHNLNYDLRISQALSLLPKLGWQMKDMRLDGRGSWSKWSREKASLNLCDSASIFPEKLEKLGLALGIPKLSLPSCGDREKLYKRCERDVEILTDAIIRYVDWLRTGQCGNWQMTGASQSWSHWRHSHYTHKILVHDNEEALKAERAAMHAGRCEAWQWGKYTGDNWYEYDWQNSYPRIARDCLLPTRLAGTVTSPSAKSLDSLLGQYAVLADCEITTAEPCVPAQSEGRTIWPTGTFRSTLWDPEIRVLREHDATIRVHRAWLYKREPALKDWAEWILSSLHDRGDTVEPWQKLILKHWSRALIGRFGMRYKTWEEYGTAPDNRIYISTLYNADQESSQELLQIGHQLFISGQEKEIDDGCPQITGYIMSEARAKLWRAAIQIGRQHVVYMDTDSLVVDSNGHDRIHELSAFPLFDGLRSKAHYRNIHIYGPRSLICDTRPCVAGMPRDSRQSGPKTWTGEVWRGAKESVRLNEAGSVSIRNTNFTLRYNSSRRFLCVDGSTVPYSLPGMVPDTTQDKRPSRTEEAVARGYPALLAYSSPAKSLPRSERRHKSYRDRVRSMQ